MALYGHLARLFALIYFFLKSYRLVSFLLVHCFAFASLIAMLNLTLPSHFFLSYSGDEVKFYTLDPSAGRLCHVYHFDMTPEEEKATLSERIRDIISQRNGTKYYIISADEFTTVIKMLREGGWLQVDDCPLLYFSLEALPLRDNVSFQHEMLTVKLLPYKTLSSDKDFYTQPIQPPRIVKGSQKYVLSHQIYPHFPQVKLRYAERVRPFTHHIDGYFLAHLDVTIKVICLLVAFSLSPLRLVYLFHRDLKSGFVDTLQSGQGASVQLYLLAQFTSSFLLCHLLLIGFSVRVLFLELDLIYSPHALLVLVCALILLSVETHLTANLVTLLLGKLSPAVLGLMLMPLQYLLLVSEFEPRTSLRFHQNPELYGFCHSVLFTIAPYMAFETFLMALIENSSRTRVQISETYSIKSHHNEAILWFTLAAYLAVIVLRAVACLLIYRLGWDNLHERTLLSCLPESIAKRFSRKQPSSHASPRNEEKHSALILSSVFKRVPRSRHHLRDVNLTLNYDTLTALYHSSSDSEAVAVLCKLLAGFHRPDSGHVRQGQSPRIAYVLPCGHLPECFNVKEYFYLLGQMHRPLYNSTAEYKHQLHQVLRFLQLEKDDALKWQTSELTAFERTKLFIGQAIMARANVILLSSPSSSFEWEEKRKLWSLISSLKRNRAIFVTTNSLQEAESLAGNLFVFTKGQIKPRHSTGPKADSREQLVLRISRKSKSSREEVENLFSQCQVAITSTRASPSEFVFYCELPKVTEKEKKDDKHVLHLLDTLMVKAKAGNVLVNRLAVNPAEDVLEEMQSHLANVGQVIEERACPRRAPSRHPFLANLQLMLWKRLLIASHRPSLFLAAFLLTLAMLLLPLFCAQFILKIDKSFYDITAASLLQSGKVSVSMSSNLSAIPILRHFCQHPNFQKVTSAGCEVLPTGVAYHEWIYRNAKTFHDYAQHYYFNIGLERDSANGYVMNAFFNEYSKLVGQFSMHYYGNMLLNLLLQHQYQLTYSKTMDWSIFFLPGTNPLEFLFATSFFSLTTLLLYFLAGYLFCRSVLISETHSGVRHLQRASQVAPLPYYLADLIASAVYVLLAYLPLYLLCEAILEPQVVHPLLRGSLDDCAWFLVFITSIITLASAWSHLLVTYPGHVLIIVQFAGPLLIKSLSFVLTVASFAVLPPTLYIILSELLILPSPENVLALWGESLLAHVYNASVAMRQEFGNNSNMVAHYEHFWSASSLRYLLQMVAYHCIFALIIALEDFWQYREKSDKRHDSEVIAHDGSVGKEKLAVENMVKSGVWPEDVVLLVHQLSRFKARSIDDVSFTIRRGQCLAIVALKGAGKSTLAGILTGRVPFNKGNFYLEQFDEATHPCKQLEGIGFAPQFDCVHELLTVQEMLMLFAKIRRIKVGHIWRELRRVAAIFQLTDHLETTGSQLNVATKRATTLAIAFIGAPSLVILDDPTHQLDPTEKVAIWSMLHAAKTASKVAILLTTSLLEEAQSLSDRIGIMIHGGLCYIGTEPKLRQEHCPGYQLYIKISPEKGNSMQYLFQLRKAFGTNFVGIGALQMTKHFMLYYLPQESTVKGKQQQTTLSDTFRRLEQLRRHFDLEAYTITIGSLEQLFLQYVPKYHALFKVKPQSQPQ